MKKDIDKIRNRYALVFNIIKTVSLTIVILFMFFVKYSSIEIPVISQLVKPFNDIIFGLSLLLSLFITEYTIDKIKFEEKVVNNFVAIDTWFDDKIDKIENKFNTKDKEDKKWKEYL